MAYLGGKGEGWGWERTKISFASINDGVEASVIRCVFVRFKPTCIFIVDMEIGTGDLRIGHLFIPSARAIILNFGKPIYSIKKYGSLL